MKYDSIPGNQIRKVGWKKIKVINIVDDKNDCSCSMNMKKKTAKNIKMIPG